MRTVSPVANSISQPDAPPVADERGASLFADAPDFTLPDHRGGQFRLRDAVAPGPGPVVVVFFRGHWCPYCRRYLAKLQSHLPTLLARGARVIAISPEPPATARHLAEQLGLAFPVLSDAGGRVIDRYGTRNGFTSARSLLPHPSVFVVDRAGVLRFKSIDRNYKKRTTIRTIVGVLDDLAAGGNGFGGEDGLNHGDTEARS